MKISVILPAFNEQVHIAKTLSALEAQTLAKSAFEVLVIDNGSVDRTVEIARSFETRLQLRVVVKAGGSIASVRNFGAALATGEVLAFLDGDCVTRPTWLMDALEVGAPDRLWGAHYLPPEDATWVGRVWADYQAKEQEGPASFIPGSNLFLYRKQFEAMGGFSEATETSEDVEISQRARRLGMETLAFPRLSVWHEGTPQTLTHFYKQNRWHGKHVLRTFLANLPSTENLPLVGLSVYTLVLFWASVLLPVWLLLRGEGWMMLLPWFLLLLPSALLSILKTTRARRPGDAGHLFVLYMTYFLGRAASLTYKPKRTHRPAVLSPSS